MNKKTLKEHLQKVIKDKRQITFSTQNSTDDKRTDVNFPIH